MSYSSSELLKRVPNLTFRRLDYWCAAGVFGVNNWSPGSGARRRFDEADVIIAFNLDRISRALGRVPLSFFADQVIEQIRDGMDTLILELADDVSVHVPVRYPQALMEPVA